MKHWNTIATAGATGLVAAAIALPAGAATKPKPIAFTASFSGTATAQQTDQTAALSASGKGTGTVLGAATISGTGKADTSQQPCAPFSGPGKMAGPGGTLTFAVAPTSKGCGDEQGQVFSISGTAAVSAGTGKLAKAHGSLHFSGVYDRGAGTFSVKFTGTLTQ